MLKRLLVAVFVLGLLLAFSGTAISGPIGDQTIPDAKRTSGTSLKGVSDWANSHPQNYRPRALQLDPEPGFPLSTTGTDTVGCDTLDYVNYSACLYGWYITAASGEAMSMRFDIPPFHAVNISGVQCRLGAKSAGASLVVSVYADNIGIPGALIYTQTYASPATGNPAQFLFTLPVNITDGGPYHIALSVAGGADSIRLGTDDGGYGTGRGSYKIAGTWYPNSSISFGAGAPGCSPVLLDPNWRIQSVVCQYYTNCTATKPGGGYYRIGLPNNTYSNDGSVLSGSGQRFKAEGPETLKSITFVHRVVNSANYTASSTNSLIVKLWGDSAGYARVSPGPLLTTTVAAGLATLFPITGNVGGGPGVIDKVNIPIPGNPVMLGYYHVTVEMSSLNPADGTLQFRFGDGSSTFGGGMAKYTPPSSGREWDNIAGNVDLFDNLYGDNTGDVAPCDIWANTCKSEFTECKIATATSCGIPTRNQQASMIPPGGCAVSYYHSWAQRIKGNPVNNIDKIRVKVRTNLVSGTCIPTPMAPLLVCVWSSIGGAPGPLIAAYPVTLPIVTDALGWNEVVIPGGLQVLGDFFIGYNIDLFGVDEFIWARYQRDGDAGVCPPTRDGAWVLTKGLGTPPTGLTDNTWYNRLATFAVNDNLVAEVDFCAIPIQERLCATENDWPTLQHDFARSGASGVGLEDAYCDLTLNWSRIKPTGRGINFSGPIIWNNYVICAFTSATDGSYEVFNLQTGVTVGSIDNATWFGDNSIIGGNIRCTPTVATIGGNPVLLIVGGIPGSITAFNLSGGFPLAFPGSMLWTFNDGGSILATRYGNIIVQNVGGTDVVFFVDDDNVVHALNATTGLPYAGWVGGPYTLTYNTQKSGATDGTNLFYSGFNPAGNGKITAIKASNGTLAWDFINLQGYAIHAADTTTIETFEAGVSVDALNGELFANSRELDGAAQGVFYRLNTQTGAIISAADADRARLTSPTIDAKRIYVPTIPAFTFAGMPFGGNMLAFSRLDGTLDYAAAGFASKVTTNTQSGFRVDGVLTCEPDSSDLFFVFSTSGYLSCFKADNGDELFSRRVDHGGSATLGAPSPSEGGMGAIGKDALGNAHLVFVDAYGGIYDMTKGVDRPRLELLVVTSAVAVPFGSPSDTVVEFPSIYTNTGCANLVVSLTASTTSNGTTVPVPGFSTIGSRLDQSTSTIADMLSDNAMKLTTVNGKKYLSQDMFGGSTDEVVSFADSRQTYNRSAAAVPGFMNQNGGSYAGDVFDPAMGNLTLVPGDTAGIRVHANGPLVNRGPNSFYCEFTLINDPDYYLDNVARRPELFLSLVGGCLLDTTTLHFGAAGVNKQHVYNTLKLASAGTEGFTIDGFNNEIAYQGFIAYGVSKHRLALSVDPWDGASDDWISIQGDPNYCDADCKPALTTSVALGAISTDGFTYTPISGSYVCQSFIDSVQNHKTGFSSWAWKNHPAPFDNDSTMGLSANTKVYGVMSAPNVGNGLLLNNMTLNVMTFKERNGNAVPGWKLMAYIDHDLGGRDTAYYDGAHSVGWATPTTGTDTAGRVVSGFIKVPYGCGYSPLKNVTACSQNRISFIPDWDTLWNQATKPAGQLALNYLSTTDQGSAYTFDEHDFTASGTHQVGVAFFAFKLLHAANTSTGEIANLATLVNQWAGFGRGDINGDGVINLTDIIRLAENVNYPGPTHPGPVPFMHQGDVNASGGLPNIADVQYMVDFYFNYGPCAKGAFVL
jgi:hypothetical protein